MKAEDIDFFKRNKGYERIFKAIRDKYKSIGRIGGVIKLDDLTDSEKVVLSNHFKKDFSKRKSVNIDVNKFAETFLNTRFEEYNLIDILESYFDEKLTSKKEEMHQYENEKEKFFNSFLSEYEGTKCWQWLKSIYENKAIGIRTINQRYDSDPTLLKRDIKYVCDALNRLPVYDGKKLRLPVFSSHITKDPHGFDADTDCGKMFINALATVFGVSDVKNSEEIAELLYRSGIVIDEISNFVTLKGLLAYSKGKCDKVFEAAYGCNEILQMPLYNLSVLDRIESPYKKVFVLENPGVFLSVCDIIKKPVPLVCAYGQPRLSVLVLLDMLYKNGTDIYYSGDFDPEGIQIAQRLFKRYPDRFHFWRYDVEDYIKALSDKTLSESRLKMVDKIDIVQLNPLVDKMKTLKKAGYQELILDDIIKDLLSMN
ncbi:TIGR02679 family protein [Thermoanaerobacterium saccharolyticum]|uniref:TIGR02679 family protein n=1 Tax=Thermoanaerobacterium saccharolyticum TaxID=28896 RepID=UPI002FD8FE25